jgi:translation initiation factor 2A
LISSPSSLSEPKKAQQQPPVSTPVVNVTAVAPPPPTPSFLDEAVAAADLDKKKKALSKKIKQIEELKTRQSNGETLNAEQVAKIATEESLKAELTALK